MAIRIALILALQLSLGLHALAAQIELKSTFYSTFVTRGDQNGTPPDTRTNFSNVPISDSFTNSDSLGPVESEADADLFMVFSLAHAAQHQIFPGVAEASVETDLVFAPLQDTLAQIQLDFLTKGQYSWGGNEVSLFDLTANVSLWSYYDQGIGGGNIPWMYDSDRGGMVATLLVPTQLFTAHDYLFKLASRGTSTFPDFDSRLTQVSGLEVPEPSALSLIALLGGGLLMANRRRHKRDYKRKAISPVSIP